MTKIPKTIKRVDFRRDPDFEGLETCHVIDSSHVFPNHYHEGIYAIGLMEKGASYVQGQRKKDAEVCAGEITLINPGQVHSGVPSRNQTITYRMIYLDVELVRAAAGDVQEKEAVYPEFEHIVVNDPPLRNMLQHVCHQQEHAFDYLEKESWLLETLGRLLSVYGGIPDRIRPSSCHRAAVRQAKEIMTADLEKKLTLEEIAQAAGLSRYHFLRVFKQATGLPPHMYRTLKRLEFAKTRLLQGCPAAEVALETGFVDQSHLTRKFRQLLGVTPGQYISASQ